MRNKLTLIGGFGHSAEPLIALLAAALVFGVASPVVSADAPGLKSADNATVSHTRALKLGPELEPEPDSSSMLVRNRHGVTFTMETGALEPDTDHTIWFIVYNNPEFCTGLGSFQCHPMVGDANNPEVQPSLFWAGDRFSDDFGQLSFSSTVFANGETPGPREFGPGLLKSRKALVQVLVKSRGSLFSTMSEPEYEPRIEPSHAGCDHVSPCREVQLYVHRP